MYEKQAPEGVEDCLPSECRIKRNIEAALRNEFIFSGYEEIETPAYEFLDVFQGGVGSYIQESMIKFVDSKGRILVLRPDLTVPIARVASTKLGKGTKRLFYILDSFSSAEPSVGVYGQFTQAGIELIGDGRYQADAEVISLAIKSLKSAGLKEFTIDIGQVAFFKSIISGFEIDESGLDTLRHAVDSKDIISIKSVSEMLGIGSEARDKILTLPYLFGKSEVFEEALKLSDNEASKAAVENLRNVYELLARLGYEDNISVDFGMLHDISYYSGIIFRGITPEIGFPVASGGRYDGLLERFGNQSPATGFSLGIKRVMIAMERQGLLKGKYYEREVVSCDMEQCGRASEYAVKQREQGKKVIFSAGLSKNELINLKEETGASSAVYFGAAGSNENL
jgi:ATP phosphoribosyltransferase regulatory subunit